MALTRRLLLTGLAAAFAAPAIVRVASIMPVRVYEPFVDDFTGRPILCSPKWAERVRRYIRLCNIYGGKIGRQWTDAEINAVLMRRQSVLRLRSIGMDRDAQA